MGTGVVADEGIGASEEFLPAVDPVGGEAGDGADWCFAFCGDDLLVVGAAEDAVLMAPTLGEVERARVVGVRRQFLGTLGERGCWSVELGEGAEAPAGMLLLGLRALYGRVAEPVYGVAGRAAQIVAWDRDHQFCGRCATATAVAAGERARRCPRCGLTAFPRLSPAVIVLIEREGSVLLARGHRFQPGFFGIIAGFVEPGESLEEAVRREVREEVGLEVADVRYFGSQPWPYPHALMVGFTARHAGGEIRLDETELAEAGWFSFDGLPRVPQQLSIARRLLDAWAARSGQMIAQP